MTLPEGKDLSGKTVVYISAGENLAVLQLSFSILSHETVDGKLVITAKPDTVNGHMLIKGGDVFVVNNVWDVYVSSVDGDPDIKVGDDIEVFQDEFRKKDDGAARPTLRTSTEEDEEDTNHTQSKFVAKQMRGMMQANTTNRNENRFADAYVEPEYEDLAQFHSINDGKRVDVLEEFRNGAQLKDETHASNGEFISDHWDKINEVRGSTAFESDLFWVSYVTTGFEPLGLNDHDPKLSQSTTFGAVGGFTTPLAHENTNETSIVFVETLRDQALSTDLANYAELLAYATAHEVGHQFNLADGLLPQYDHHDPSGTSLMSVLNLGQTKKLIERFLASQDVSAIRSRVRSPGRGSDNNFAQPSPE